ncbi:PAS domain S-box protein [Azospirillum isscasi]|uniref:histidine kinase n=1 Tax=Azospirillum isscasi TaxID=3053926 RepID=A0ABU0WK41_9PROT|nr:PAS domain S-box protein [Azospirillum isscasi]MDQ2104577.1 PAS domain S-box protein [Azospirillum isscasi]
MTELPNGTSRASNAPSTKPPATKPPATNPPATNPPATNPPAEPAETQENGLRFPLFVALSYAIVSSAWIAASDRAVDLVFATNVSTIQTYKGWAFIALTAVLLFIVLWREGRRRFSVETALRDRETVLQRERSLFEAVLRQAPIGISICGAPDGKPIILNDQAVAITQVSLTDEEASRYEGYGARHADGSPYTMEEYPTVRALREGRAIDWEPMIYHRPDGRTLELDISSAPVRDGDGHIVASVTIFVDNTDTKAAKRALAEREDMLRTTTEALPGALFVADPDGRNIYSNQSFQTYTGLSANQLSGDGWMQAVHPEDRQAALAGWESAVGRGVRYQSECRLRRLDGTYRWHLILAVRETRTGRWIGTGTDVHAIKEAELALAQSEERLRRAIEDAPFPVMVHAEDGEVVLISQAWLDATGYTAAELSTISDWLERAYGERRGAVRTNIQRLHQLDRPIKEGEYDIRTADGRGLTWAFRSSPIGCDSKGRRLVVSMAADMTDRKEAESRLRLLMREVDHRAKNALAVVQSIVLLSRTEDPKEFANAVEGRVTAMARAHSLLAANRWSGADLATLAQEELSAFTQDRSFTVVGPPVTIAAEAVQSFSMVLHELVTNAAKYGALSVANGSVAVSWRVDKTAGLLRVEWTESGGPTVTPPTRQGFGSILLERTILGQMHGELVLEWLPEGLRCRIALPRDCFVVSGVFPTPKPAFEPANDQKAAAPGARVLVVEDEALTAMGLQQVLEDAGYRVIGPVAHVQDAIDLARGSPPDLAVLDVNLFGQPSFPVAELLDDMGVPFLFCTGYGSLNTPNDRLRQAPVLAKPVRPDRLLRTIGALLLSRNRPATGVVPS